MEVLCLLSELNMNSFLLTSIDNEEGFIRPWKSNPFVSKIDFQVTEKILWILSEKMPVNVFKLAGFIKPVIHTICKACVCYVELQWQGIVRRQKCFSNRLLKCISLSMHIGNVCFILLTWSWDIGKKLWGFGGFYIQEYLEKVLVIFFYRMCKSSPQILCKDYVNLKRNEQ